MPFRAQTHPSRKSVLLVLLLSVSACRPLAKPSSQPYVIGSDDITLLFSDPSEATAIAKEDGQELEDLVGAFPLIVQPLDNGSYKFCSGILVEKRAKDTVERWIVTNLHCQLENDETRALLPCSKTLAVFGFHKGQQDEAVSLSCEEDSWYGDQKLDLAAFAVKDSQAVLGPGRKITDLTPESMIGRDAWIIHYPNLPRNLESSTQFSKPLPLAASTTTNCKVIETFGDRFREEILRYGIGHDCDLTHGSSGSALMDRKTGEILGINWGGIIYDNNESGDKTTINVATAAPFLNAFLDKKDPEESREKQATLSPTKAPPPSAIEEKTAAKKKKTCGVVKDQKHATSQAWFFFTLLTLPILLAKLVNPRPLLRKKEYR